eukprot:NODE_2443_length_1176_cov_24.986654_g2328_i0.p1 GENE.NODE_2443_length_1176_cov_24.986654_g2328_i0~~NODE_2443_length_1176_cov_24.986654_g2328_i0.p1  ORF type:complete len:360 (-),score=66.16 NODE_2443_length_1176_cov_24.986654_g2328_i0:96-1133(-)
MQSLQPCDPAPVTAALSRLPLTQSEEPPSVLPMPGTHDHPNRGETCLRRARTTFADHFEEQWRCLQSGVEDLILYVCAGNDSPKDIKRWQQRNLSFYTIVYNLCTNRNKPTQFMKEIYENLQHAVQSSLSGYALIPQSAPAARQTRAAATTTLLCFNRLGGDLPIELVELIMCPGVGYWDTTAATEVIVGLFTSWRRHEAIMQGLGFCFRYIDYYYTQQNDVCKLKTMMARCFTQALTPALLLTVNNFIQDCIEAHLQGNAAYSQFVWDINLLFQRMEGVMELEEGTKLNLLGFAVEKFSAGCQNHSDPQQFIEYFRQHLADCIPDIDTLCEGISQLLCVEPTAK